jgi:hypothetical protein
VVLFDEIVIIISVVSSLLVWVTLDPVSICDLLGNFCLVGWGDCVARQAWYDSLIAWFGFASSGATCHVESCHDITSFWKYEG